MTKHAKPTRTKAIFVRCTDEERAMLKRLAESAGVSEAGYVRMLIRLAVQGRERGHGAESA